MFVVDDGLDAAAAPVRARLAELGDSLLLVGAGTPTGPGRSGPWRGHVHADDPEAVLDVVARLGRARDVTVQDLHAQACDARRHGGADSVPQRGGGPAVEVVALVAGPGVAAAIEGAGVTVLAREARSLDDAAARGGERRVLLLPGSPELLAAARAGLDRWRGRGWDVTVLDAPTDVHVLAAVAVHDPAVPDPLPDLTAALEGLAAIVVEEADAEGLDHAAVEALGRLLERSPEPALVTVVTGAATDVDGPVVAALVAALHRHGHGHGDVELSVVAGADPAYLLTLGVEA